MSSVFQKFSNGLAFGLWSSVMVLAISLAYAATTYYSDLPTASSWATMRSTDWNALVDYANKAVKQDTEVLTVTGGKVGIGTASPGAKLSINGWAIRDDFTGAGWSFVGNWGGSNIQFYHSATGPVRIFNSWWGLALGVNDSGTSVWNVGIGTVAPYAKLDVNGPSGIISFLGTTPLGINVMGSLSTNDYVGIDFRNTQGGSYPQARIGSYQSGGGSYIQFGTSNNYVSGITNIAMTIGPSGNIGMGGVTSPQAALEVGTSAGNGRIRNPGMPSGATGYYVCKDVNGELNYGASCSSSDQALKENVRTLTGALEKLSSVRGVSFEWKNSEKWRGDGEKIWVIAQEIETVYPQVVYRNEKWIRSVDYGALIGPLVEALKELKNRNDELEARIKILESENN